MKKKECCFVFQIKALFYFFRTGKQGSQSLVEDRRSTEYKLLKVQWEVFTVDDLIISFMEVQLHFPA